MSQPDRVASECGRSVSAWRLHRFLVHGGTAGASDLVAEILSVLDSDVGALGNAVLASSPTASLVVGAPPDAERLDNEFGGLLAHLGGEITQQGGVPGSIPRQSTMLRSSRIDAICARRLRR